MSGDGKCPDIYECRLSNKDMKFYANQRIRIQNKVLREKLKRRTKIVRAAKKVVRASFALNYDATKVDDAITNLRGAIDEYDT